MSLQPLPISSVPEQTASAARAAFRKGNVFILMRDELGTIYEDEAFAHLFPKRGQPAEAPWRLALVTVMQFAEGLSDRQAADAVRARIDWKYALGLELDDPGFDYSILSKFRARLITRGAEHQLLETLLSECKAMGLLKARGKQRTDSTHVLGEIRGLNRLEGVGETMRHALNMLATEAPNWLRGWAPSEWYDRYGPRFEEYRLPKGDKERQALADIIGVDLIGPVPPDSSWQAREGGFDISRFGIDWEAEVATCPEGKRTRYWNPARDRHGRDVIAARFDKVGCAACPSRSRCTRSKTSGREITLRPRVQFEALQDARRRQATGEFDALYDARAGVEATLSQGIRAFGLRRSRYIGARKTHLQHVITAVAINLIRLMAWLARIPRAQRRRSQFTRLAPSGSAV